MTETICPKCKARNSVETRAMWRAKDCRIVGVISTVNVQCLKCNEIYMTPVHQGISYSKTELNKKRSE